MANYPDIAAQQAALRAARENVRAEAGVFLPSFTGTAFGEREKSAGGTIAPGFPGFFTDIYAANLNVSYTLDLFGGERRTLEGLQAQAEQQNFQLEASYLTLTFNVASAAISLAAISLGLMAILRAPSPFRKPPSRTCRRQYSGTLPRRAGTRPSPN